MTSNTGGSSTVGLFQPSLPITDNSTEAEYHVNFKIEYILKNELNLQAYVAELRDNLISDGLTMSVVVAAACTIGFLLNIILVKSTVSN